MNTRQTALDIITTINILRAQGATEDYITYRVDAMLQAFELKIEMELS